MNYKPVHTLSVPLYLRQAEADQNMAPQSDEGTLNLAIARFCDMTQTRNKVLFDYYQAEEVPDLSPRVWHNGVAFPLSFVDTIPPDLRPLWWKGE